MTKGYQDVEVNPFAASESILKGLPGDRDPKVMLDRMAQPATRAELVDCVTAVVAEIVH